MGLYYYISTFPFHRTTFVCIKNTPTMFPFSLSAPPLLVTNPRDLTFVFHMQVFTLQQSDLSPLPHASVTTSVNKNTTSASHSRSVNTSFTITEQPSSRASSLSTVQIHSLLHLLPSSTIQINYCVRLLPPLNTHVQHHLLF